MWTVQWSKEFGMKTPAYAGSVPLRWKDDIELPKFNREERTIALPKRENVSYFFLEDGKKFIAWMHNVPLVGTDNRPTGETSDFLVFGGDDEGYPFFCYLEREALKEIKKGEEAFIAALKPPVAEQLERLFDIRAVRIGRWFALPLHMTWKEVMVLRLLAEQTVSSGKDPLISHYERDGYYGMKVDGHAFFLCSISQRYHSSTVLAMGTLTLPNGRKEVLREAHILVMASHINKIYNQPFGNVW